MATCNVNTLMRDASCFTCLPPGYYYPIKLALLARWLKSLNPTADTSVQGLMNQGQCFSCLPPGQWYPLRLALLCRIMSGQGGGGGGGGVTPNPPTNLDISDASTNGNTILTWNQGSAPTTNEIWLSVNGAAFSLLASQPGAATTYTDGIPMAGGDVNQYKVRAVTGGNPSAFSNTVSAGQDIVFNGSGEVSFSYPDMVHAYGDFLFQNLGSVTSISVPVLRIVEHAFNAINCPVLTTLNISALKTTGAFLASGNTLLTTLSLPVFTNPGSLFDVSSSGYTSLSLPAMTTCGGDLSAISCGSLTNISFPSLTTVVGTLKFFSCTVLASASFPSLTSIGQDMFCSSCPALTTLTCTSLASIVGSFSGFSTGLTSLSLPALAGSVFDFDFSSNSSLVTVSVPLLGTVADQIFATGCPLLTTITMTGLTSLQGSGTNIGIDATGDAALLTVSMPSVIFSENLAVIYTGCHLSAASVNQVLHRGVVSGVSACDFELSGGTNSAPSGAGVADKATLIGAGNTVNTN